MTTAIEYALMAGRAYITTRDKINWFPVPEGWLDYAHVPNNPDYPQFTGADGFEAVSFQNIANPNEIVISFAGTATGADWTNGNIPLALGNLSEQLRQAADYYLQVKASAPAGATITFTGHSLGGGLASLMAVFFGESAFTFDQAPFQNTAQNSDLIGQDGYTIYHSAAQDLRAYLAGKATVNGVLDPQIASLLAPLDAYITAADPFNPSPVAADTLAYREARVTNMNVEGEILSEWFIPFNRIGTVADIPNNTSGVSGTDLHSQALLTAYLQSNQNATTDSNGQVQSLSEATFKLQDLLKMIFDSKLYYNDPNNTDAPVKENFLERIVKHQAGIWDAATGTSAILTPDKMVDRFTSDLWKLAQEGGMTMSDGNDANGTPTNFNNVSKALTAFAMQMYYEDTANAINPNKELFTQITGGLQFDMADVSKEFKASFDKGEKIDLSKAKGYKEYFEKYLQDFYVSFNQGTTYLNYTELNLINSLLPYMRDWYVQAGAVGMEAVDLMGRNAFMLGGQHADTLVGGDGADLLVGNGGNDIIGGGMGNDVLLGGMGEDTLIGGAGNDYLLGGSGNDILDGGADNDTLKGGDGHDIYAFSGSFGTDIITDSDGLGAITMNGQILDTATQQMQDIYKNDTSGYTLVKLNGGNTLAIVKEGDANRIIVQDWSASKNLGIDLQDSTPAIPNATLKGDFKKLIDDHGTLSTDDDTYVMTDGNYTDDGVEANALDLISGTGGNDVIDGGGGDDWLSGMAGDDHIEGGSGSDIIQGGAGKDTINGGAGDDYIYGSSDGAIDKPENINFTRPDNSITNPKGTGFNWISGYYSTFANGVPIDHISTNVGRNRIAGDQGNIIDGGAGSDSILAGTGADYVHGGADKDFIFGMDKDDILFGDGENDVIYGDGNKPSDTSVGWTSPEEHGNDIIDGGDGEDYLFGQGKDDIIFGGKDNDRIWGDEEKVDELDPAYHGNDYLDGGDGNDQIIGGGKDDILIGGIGNDNLWGDDDTLPDQYHGNDFLYGGAGTDQLIGGAGNDYLEGGAEDDIVLGGSGKDTYVFNKGDGIDIVYDTKADNNIFRFGAGISEKDIKLNLGSLLLDLGNGDKIHIYNEDQLNANGFDKNDVFNSSSIGNFEFADGTTLSIGALLERGFDLDGTSFDDTIFGTNTTDRISGFDGNDTLLGGAGNDILYGGAGDDVLYGDGSYVTTALQGDDVLNGGDGNDVLSGEAGMDQLSGGTGADRLFGGTGQDVLNGDEGSDELQGGDEADTLFGGAGDDMLIGGMGNDLLNGGEGSDELQGNEGNDTVNGDAGNDNLYGQAGNDLLNGGEGRDELHGGDEADTLAGGAGNDILYGENGNDTYLFGRGDGQDVINNYDATAYSAIDTLQFAADVRAEDVHVTKQGNDLVFAISGTADTITVRNYYLQTGGDYSYPIYGYQIDQVKFADGTTWTPATMPKYNAGSSGNDNNLGTSGNDIFGSSSGSDSMSGGNGSDTYSFGTGSGKDSISDYAYAADINTILIDATLTAADVTVRRVNNSYVLGINNAPDELTIVNGALANYGIDQIKFADGTVWTRDTLSTQFLVATDQDDQIWGTESVDTINALRGNDTVNGGGGDDSIDGGAGNDIINGGNGNDTLYGGAGNDNISGEDGNDYLSGGEGDDTLTGGYGNDTLEGGAGNDLLIGDGPSLGNASDTYLFDVGSGFDTIIDLNGFYGSPTSVVRLGAGFLAATIVAIRQGNDLVLRSPDGADQLTIIDQYLVDYSNGTRGGVVQIIFSDNTVWDQTMLATLPVEISTNGADVLLGTVADDTLSGLGGNDTIYGYAGNDTLDGGTGDDTLIGGADHDIYIVDSTSDVVTEIANEGTDTVQSSVDYTLSANVENLTLTGNAAIYGSGNELANRIVGNSRDNVLTGGVGNDFLNGGVGNDTLIGGTGDDSYQVDSAADSVVEYANEGFDTVSSSVSYVLPENVENLMLSNTGLSAGGNALDNMLVSYYGNNVLTGGLGNDTYNIRGNDTVVENANEGVDTVQVDSTYTLGANLENLTLTGISAINGTGNELNNILTGNSAANVLAGGLGDDTYVNGSGDTFVENINEGNDTVQTDTTYTLGTNFENITLTGLSDINGTGNGVVNKLVGNAGNNLLDGGLGADTLQGGLGNDSYIVDNSADVIIENANEGTDSVQSTATYALSENIENLTLSGTAIINGTGNSQNNTLTGNSAANVLSGGAGDDTYFIGAGDTVIENANEGVDSVQTALTFTLGANVENLMLTGTATINGTGNASNNILIGNTANNTLTGGAGDDTLDGGAGVDKMIGGTGNDYYVIESTRDAITENVNEGIDTVQTSFTYTLGTNLENLILAPNVLINGTGNAANNVITGNTLDNILNGAAGTDTLIGGGGNDTYIVDNSADTIIENANEGMDLVQSSATYALSANIENMTLTGTAAINATGNSLNNTLTGNSAANVLAGGAGDDTYVVGAGDTVVENANEGVDTVQSSVTFTLGANMENLTLTGASVVNGSGNNLNNILSGAVNTKANVLTGGLGDDIYVVGSGDSAVENTNEGTDSVQSAVTFTLGANIENLLLTGTAAINGTGNALNNVLTGNSAANVLSGGAGDDTYFVGAGDSVVESLNQGIDTVQSVVSFTLGANIENLVLGATDSAALNGTGNLLNNVITGNSLNNVLDGGAGADTMIGGLGDDTYVVDNAADVVIENAGGGNDTVQAYISYASSGNVENVTLMGTAAINATGDAWNNFLTGNSAANILTGGAGDDTYVIGAGDTVIENANEGTDTIQSAATYTLTVANVENLTLTGTAAINGTGNSLNNVITGNAGNNVLDGGAGADTLYGGDGNDTLYSTGDDAMNGGLGDDLYIFTGLNDISFSWGDMESAGGGGTDTIMAYGSISLQSSYYYSGGRYVSVGNIENATLMGANNKYIRGTDAINVLIGNSGNNVLYGFGGDDRLEGGDGHDTLYGGEGTNTLMGGAGDDTMGVYDGGYGPYTNYMYGGIGNDTYQIRSAADTVNESAGEGIDLVDYLLGGSYTLGANVENLRFYSGVGTGNALNNVITASTGADTLYGLAGDDTLDGGLGADTLAGGSGNDTFIVNEVGDVVTENLNEGTDTVQSTITYTLGANLENLTLSGTAAINGTGNGLNNVLTGNAAANILTGGLGDDIYVIGSSDTVVENANEGTDTVQSSFAYTLGINLENLTLTGTGVINGTGNSVNNVLTGNSAANVLDGGVGADTMIGGFGNDTYIVDNSADVITENAGEGTDTINSSVSFTLSANVENIVLTGVSAINGIGNVLNNVLTGNGAANILSGGLGDDIYIVADTLDTLVENANEGSDTVQSSVTYTLGTNLENLKLTGYSAINGTGNSLNNILTGNGNINVLSGGLGDDTYVAGYGATAVENSNEGTDVVQSSVDYTLGANIENLVLTGYAYSGSGNTLNNMLTGNTYGNTLDGGSGVDTMLGGLGNDIYIVDNSADVVTENANEGTDTVQSTATYTLSANVENLTLTGTSAIDGSGNALNNILTGNSAANVLTGGMGDDTYVASSGDTLVENASEGNDTVQTDVSYTLGANLENLALTGTAAINGTGNALNNVITGNNAVNVLTGGLGDDTYVVGSGDAIVENSNEGSDTVQTNFSYSLVANLENLTLTGAAAINGTGNALNNVITGNSAANVLTGGLGDDTYVLGSGDIIIESADEGNDTVQTNLGYSLGANLENLTLTGTSAVNGTGNASNNFLIGNSANNTLDGQSGNDTMSGGAGDDIYYVDSATDIVVEQANEGSDTVYSAVDYILSNNLENLTMNYGLGINGTGNALNNILTGGITDNLLIGLDGDDTLDGGLGADTLVGGTGNDTYVVDNINDVVGENIGEGVDIVQSRIDYTLGENVENLTLLGIAAISGVGNALDNIIVGSYANNVLDGGIGADSMSGGSGDDTYIVDDAGDMVTELSYDGIDTVASSITYTLAANVENLTLASSSAINGTGNNLDNILIGNSANNILTGEYGNDFLDGRIGADTMIGGDGNDVYIIDNVDDIVQDTSGTDRVQSSISYTLGADLEDLTLTGMDAINAVGNAYRNVLIGNMASNILSGGAGDDVMIGGAGDDTYIVDNANDWVGEYQEEGSDTVLTTIDYTLGVNLENLNLIGSSAINGTGNLLDNVLQGNAAVNTLAGGAGNDLLNGGMGNDILNDGDGNDVLEGADGNDTLSDTSGNNLFNGGAGTDTLTGNTGNELFIGGSGNDTITTGTGADIIAFNQGDGQDTVVASSGADNTISLGGGINYVNLVMSKAGNDLIFSTGSGDQITLQNWYSSTSNHSVANLQIVLDNSTYNPASADTLLNQQVQTFDFAALANNFDTALAANPTLTAWSMTDALLTAHLAGSDTAALGGDLAYQYGLNNSLAGIGLASAQTVMNDASFGTAAQTLKPLDQLQAGAVKLG